MSKRFLIETVLPIRELSEEARREKAIRHGHISTLHVWWARRPLVTARAAVLGALLTEDSEVDARFIANLCRWEVHDGDPGGHYLLEQARCRIHQRFGDQPPKVLDSFAGGGSIPLEALRLGAQAYAVEYNPVAYLILKATVEYPQRYGHRLLGEVKRWGEWVLERAKEALAPFYPQVNGETPIAYLWSRTIRCPNPACGAEIPLFRQFWLARKANKAVALKPLPNHAAKQVDFTIVEGKAINFDPSKGTVARGNAVCLLCHTSADEKYVKAEAQAGRMGHRLVAVVTTRGRGQGRTYRIATNHDHAAFHNAEAALHNLTQTPSPWAFGLSWIPDEPMDPVHRQQLHSVRRALRLSPVGSTVQPPPVAGALHFWQVGARGASAHPAGDQRPRLRQSGGDLFGVCSGRACELQLRSGNLETRLRGSLCRFSVGTGSRWLGLCRKKSCSPPLVGPAWSLHKSAA
jgi:putative DNA methylase